ncbi:bifunctional 3-(3-hydroxy-phenyl)propionate/3-hydroxycinnamic acid hydroxylase [Sinimarinibacterium sp. CAU 1509]|uniref:bifunctional 3-(3-hydroxy-phenyl)propionate/3-hydroxycinnamic acid hydroxylase MhpA n=1 Tax=Sinimarinibacterium sp. CAU 1509 TaxID=2562283 RepID=UPI0010ACFA92|nr:bifunctional 3-(3-hydroxy-phenyl)propionate/3-hydroxycinnamic acid hydroxylase [Sinimarinibacterium sp. CAU 1509]TJY59485.1 bifunctional 3-(3-hydroxy-phenyl)propionate/3-hydroxycinnamic acid hydroxylase [Sinimarinibacterium sp. CAU 1509]
MSKNDIAQSDADVVISGMGPTGLVLAHMLGMRGHTVIVLEREPVFYGNARAVYTDDECMRALQHIGAAEEVQKKMLQETPVQFVRPDGSVIGQYFPLDRPYGWPVVNFFYQPYLETTLTEMLGRYPSVEIRRGRELIEFQQDAEGVTVTHQATRTCRFSDQDDSRVECKGDADVQSLRARYLVGADGGRSTVRERLGIRMSGKSFPEHWLVVDLKEKDGHDALRHIPYFNFVVDPKLPVVSCVQPDGFHRFEFMMMDGQTRDYLERPETVRMLLSKWVDPDAFEIKRKLVYTFNALIAEKWREGRVLLAGDAAHMTPQFMGQGASSGIRDAYNLGWKLSAVLKGDCGDQILESYGLERHDHAKAMIDVSVMMKDVVSMTHPIGTRLRDIALNTIAAMPVTRRWLQDGGFKPTPVYKKGRYIGMPRRRRGAEGTLAPQPEVRCIDGHRVLLDDLLGEGFAVIGLNVDPRAHLSAPQRARLEALGVRYITLFPYGRRPQGLSGVSRSSPEHLMEVEDVSGHMTRWFARAGFARHGITLLRPDRFVFGLVKPDGIDSVVDALLSQLHCPAA